MSRQLAAAAGLPIESALTSAKELPMLVLSVDVLPSGPTMADQARGELQR